MRYIVESWPLDLAGPSAGRGTPRITGVLAALGRLWACRSPSTPLAVVLLPQRIYSARSSGGIRAQGDQPAKLACVAAFEASSCATLLWKSLRLTSCLAEAARSWGRRPLGSEAADREPSDEQCSCTRLRQAKSHARRKAIQSEWNFSASC